MLSIPLQLITFCFKPGPFIMFLLLAALIFLGLPAMQQATNQTAALTDAELLAKYPDLDFAATGETMPVIQPGEQIELIEQGLAAAAGLYAELHIIEETSNHAAKKHGEEAQQGKNCLEKFGSTMTLREKGSGNIHFLCFDVNLGKWFDIIVGADWVRRGSDRVNYLITVFSPDPNQFRTIDAYISFLKNTPKYMAVLSKYIISANTTRFVVVPKPR